MDVLNVLQIGTHHLHVNAMMDIQIKTGIVWNAPMNVIHVTIKVALHAPPIE